MAGADEKKGTEEEYGDMNDDADFVPELITQEKAAGDQETAAGGQKATEENGEENGKDDKAAEDVDDCEDDYKHQPLFVCCCGASFQFLGQITSHKKKACEWIYVCPHCDRVYKDFDKMEVHKKKHVTTVKAEVRAQAIVSEPLKKEEAKKADAPAAAASADAEKKPKAAEEQKSIPKVERQLPKKTLLVRPPNVPRPNFPQGNRPIGNRPNFMPNQGMMNPQMGMMNPQMGMMNPQMGMMNPQMGMMNPQMAMGNCGPMNMGMGNFGPNMMGPNMMGMNNMNMGMNMNMMGGNMMGGMNMGMGMNMGNFGPNNFGPMGGPMGRNPGGNMGGMPGGNMGGMPGGNMAAGQNIPGPNRPGPNVPGQNMGSKIPAASRPYGSDVHSSDKRDRELSPPGRRSPLRRSLSPVRRRDSRSPPLRRDSPRRDELSWRDSPRERSREGDDLYRGERPDRLDRPSPWAQRSMTREEFLSSSRDEPSAKDLRDEYERRDDRFSRREYSPRDDGPPGLGKYGFSRDGCPPPPKMMRPY